MPYATRILKQLSSLEISAFKKLSTPQKVQDFLDTLPINFELNGETDMSPRRVLRQKRAHCVEGALFAAAALAIHGHKPLLVDFRTTGDDEDHVVAVFKINGLWGAISKTNHAILRYRDPVYRSIRELAMSYAHEYFKWNGTKSLVDYSAPFDLRRYPPKRWVTAEDELDWLVEDLDSSRHYPIGSKKNMRKLRRASQIEIAAMKIVEWKQNGRRAI